jgi:hypothetical protein
MRRRARRKRARGVKREVELLDVEVGGVVGGKSTIGGRSEGRLNRQSSVYGSTVAGRAGELRGGLVGREDEAKGEGGKWDEAGAKSGNMRGEEEWEQDLPAYHR